MKKFKVIGFPWHVSHQYELAHLPFIEQYDLLINPYRYWSDEARPMPKNVKYVPYYEEGKYDFAILHIDQQAIYLPELNKRWARLGKGRLYEEVNETIKDIPKIVINHMTPFHDHLDSNETVEIIKEMVGDNHMIVNSYEAKKQWGWGHTIVHGMNSDDWWDLPKEPRVCIVLSKEGMEKAYRRLFLETVLRHLNEMNVPYIWIGKDKFCSSWDEYRTELGSSLVFFFPAWQSPRPRARTEAMLSGCCVLTTPYQDADTFIEDGVNGFLTSRYKITDPRIIDNPQRNAELLRDLVFNRPDEAIRIGQEGKKTAQKLFNQNTFAKQWEDYLKEIEIWK